MNLRRRVVTLAIAAAVAPLSALAQSPAKVGFIYFGPVGDAGWTYQHDLGRKALEQAFGSRIAVRTVANTLEGPDGERVARELVSDGSKVVFAVGFGYMREVLRIAGENPDRCFATASAYMTAPNAGAYNAKWHEGGYLAGIVAGKSSKSGNLGFVGAHLVPDVMWYLNAFALGARSVNPNAKVRAVFVNSWSDPPKETDAAIALISTGADVLTHYTNSPAVVTAADARGVPSISFHSDMSKFAPKHYLTGVTHHWENYYTKVTAEALAGRCSGDRYFGGLKEGAIKLAPFGPKVAREVVELVASRAGDIASERFRVFSGPIKDNAGVVRVPAGSHLADADLGKMNWFVDGIVAGQR